MYVKISPNTTDAGGLASYLTKEDTLIERQLEGMQQDPAFKDHIQDYASYLTKEDRMGQKEYFFNNASDRWEKEDVTMKIGQNRKGLKDAETHFYMVTFSPSEKELLHVRNMAEQQAVAALPKGTAAEVGALREELMRDMLKTQTKNAMDLYALNFGREGIEKGADLVWYGKVEKDRYWKHDSPEVLKNRQVFSQIRKLERAAEKAGDGKEATKCHRQIRELKSQLVLESSVRKGGVHLPIYENMPKSGLNYHVHVVVSRRDVGQKISLSPLSKQRSSPNHKVNGVSCKAGFDRDAFAKKVEQVFDWGFRYTRQFGETYEGRKLAKNDPEKYRDAKLVYDRANGIEQRRIPVQTRNKSALAARKNIYYSVPGNLARSASHRLAHKAVMAYLSQVGLTIPGLNVVNMIAKFSKGHDHET